MASELSVAAEAKEHGLDRDEARRQLMIDFPTLTAAEIEKALDASYGRRVAERMDTGIRRSATTWCIGKYTRFQR